MGKSFQNIIFESLLEHFFKPCSLLHVFSTEKLKNHFKITYLTKSHMIITDVFPNHALLELDYYEITEIL